MTYSEVAPDFAAAPSGLRLLATLTRIRKEMARQQKSQNQHGPKGRHDSKGGHGPKPDTPAKADTAAKSDAAEKAENSRRSRRSNPKPRSRPPRRLRTIAGAKARNRSPRPTGKTEHNFCEEAEEEGQAMIGVTVPCVGWETSETHQRTRGKETMGFVSLYPSYALTPSFRYRIAKNSTDRQSTGGD